MKNNTLKCSYMRRRPWQNGKNMEFASETFWSEFFLIRFRKFLKLKKTLLTTKTQSINPRSQVNANPAVAILVPGYGRSRQTATHSAARAGAIPHQPCKGEGSDSCVNAAREKQSQHRSSPQWSTIFLDTSTHSHRELCWECHWYW